MTRRRKILLLLAGLLLAVGAYWFTTRGREPAYKGKPLSYWVDHYSRWGTEAGDQEAPEALRAIGAKAVPFLLEGPEYQIPGWEGRLTAFAQKHQSLHRLTTLLYRDLERKLDRGRRAGRALAFLSRTEGSVMPAIIVRLNDSGGGPGARRAAEALGRLVPETLPKLFEAATNQQVSPQVRLTCMDAIMGRFVPVLNYFGDGGGDGHEIPRANVFVQCLGDTNPAIRAKAADELANLMPEPAKVVPALRNALQDPDPQVRQRAASAITAYRARLPYWQQGLKSPYVKDKEAVTNALRAIAPEFFTNTPPP